jgi:hypothetical protein
MLEASLYVDLHRMPELFCGFPQAPGEGPTLYPVACAPQSWSAASVFLLVQACLGLHINGPEAQVYFTRPHPPISLGELRIHHLEVAGATVDVLLVHPSRTWASMCCAATGTSIPGFRSAYSSLEPQALSLALRGPHPALSRRERGNRSWW